MWLGNVVIRCFVFPFLVCSSSVFSVVHQVGDSNTLRTAIESCNSVGTGDEIIFNQNIMLDDHLPAISGSYTIDGAGHALDGAATYRGFVIISSASPTIKNLTISNTVARGGDGAAPIYGGGSGGGGLGAGGGICVLAGSSPIIENVFFTNCEVKGGDVIEGGGELFDQDYEYLMDRAGIKVFNYRNREKPIERFFPDAAHGYYIDDVSRNFVVSDDYTYCAGVVFERTGVEHNVDRKKLFVRGLDGDVALASIDVDLGSVVSGTDVGVSLWSTPRGLYVVEDGNSAVTLFKPNGSTIEQTVEQFPAQPRSFMKHVSAANMCYFTTVEDGVLSIYELSGGDSPESISGLSPLDTYNLPANTYPCTLSLQHYAKSQDNEWVDILCFSCNNPIESYSKYQSDVENSGTKYPPTVSGTVIIPYNVRAHRFRNHFAINGYVPISIVCDHNDVTKSYVLTRPINHVMGRVQFLKRNNGILVLDKFEDLENPNVVQNDTFDKHFETLCVTGGDGFAVSYDSAYIYLIGYGFREDQAYTGYPMLWKVGLNGNPNQYDTNRHYNQVYSGLVHIGTMLIDGEYKDLLFSIRGSGCGSPPGPFGLRPFVRMSYVKDTDGSRGGGFTDGFMCSYDSEQYGIASGKMYCRVSFPTRP